LDVTNPAGASSDLRFQALLHSYFRLPEGVLPSDVTIEGYLTGLRYKDKTLGYEEATEDRQIFTFINETDRVYANAPKTFAVKYGKSQQGLKFETTNMSEYQVVCTF
jgi:glucose-6-phosphate 1-epimerase